MTIKTLTRRKDLLNSSASLVKAMNVCSLRTLAYVVVNVNDVKRDVHGDPFESCSSPLRTFDVSAASETTVPISV